MHDPMTQICVIRFPWYHTSVFGKSKFRHWEPFITVWHIDPERHGSDDSCGWFRPPFKKWQKELLDILAGDEARTPWFMALDAKSNNDPVLCENLVRGAFHLISLCLRNRGHSWLAATPNECEQWAIEMTHNQIDNFRSSLCFQSGYHSNWYKEGTPNSEEDDKWFREQQARSFFGAILGRILRERRWWFQHPRWHVIHWKRVLDYKKPIGNIEEKDAPQFAGKYFGLPMPIVGWKLQVHPILQFKRWAFSRCSKCDRWIRQAIANLQAKAAGV